MWGLANGGDCAGRCFGCDGLCVQCRSLRLAPGRTRRRNLFGVGKVVFVLPVTRRGRVVLAGWFIGRRVFGQLLVIAIHAREQPGEQQKPYDLVHVTPYNGTGICNGLDSAKNAGVKFWLMSYMIYTLPA